MSGTLNVLGNSHIRKDAIEKVTGTARYIPDIKLPNMLHAKFLRSPHAHARIKHIDTTRAENLTGVVAILTHRDVPKHHPHRRMGYLLDETVHFPGEEVAAVAAISPEIAEEALRLIDVDYEILPAVFDPKEALKPGAPLARREFNDNIYKGTKNGKPPRLGDDGVLRLEFGDTAQGMGEADVVLERGYETPMQYNCSPASRTVLCEWVGDKLTCWADTQLPLELWHNLSQALSIPMSDVRLISNYAVGGYGAKSPDKIAALAAVLARRTGRPVRAAFSRAEDFIATHHRLSYQTRHKVGVKKDGTVTALETHITAMWGSDTPSPCIGQAAALLSACTMLYRTENAKAETIGVLTNIVGYGPMNGFGTPEAVYAVERLMDEAAEAIDMDPVAFRLNNCPRYGSRAMDLSQVLSGPVEWGVLGKDFDIFPELIEKTAEKARWKETWQGWKTPVTVDGYRRRGIGVAMGIHHTAIWPGSAIVKMNQDGTANVMSGAVEIGQGYATALAQVVAETLGIHYEDVHPVLADTAVTPAAIGNVASSGTTTGINAAKKAAEDVRRKMFDIAAARLNVTVDDLEARERKIFVKGSDLFVSIPVICAGAWQISGVGNNPPLSSYRDEATGKTIYPYASVISFAEVDVDMETGNVDLIRAVCGNDTGNSINPVIIDNQIDLGMIMASGWVLSEEFRIDGRTGMVVNPNLLDYKLQTFLDVPKREDFGHVVMAKPCVWGPFGAKGFSEAAMTALAPAIANAVYNATGVRVYCGVLTARNILGALQAKR
jgi:xanthine dehydrogenase molybdenum-binding subunit